MNTAGKPLEVPVRRDMEARFGADFSRVRVHTDEAAAATAGGLRAAAYTIGTHIVFGAGHYRPGSADGLRTLAHELTHVLQQRSPAADVRTPLGVSHPQDPAEREAEAIAERMAGSRRTTPAGAGVSSSGSHAVTAVSTDCRSRNTVQRCGPVPCDCATELRVAAEAPSVVSRIAEDAATPVGESSDTADADREDSVHDGDTPPGGPILPVPDSPDELVSPEPLTAEGGSTAGQRTSLPAAHDRHHDPVPSTRNPWISRIAIDLTSQTIRYEWNNGSPGRGSSISSGRGQPCTVHDPCADQNNLNCTPTGTFSPAFLGGPGYTNSKGDAMAWYVDIGTGRGIGIHDSQPVLGRPASHGCVRVPMDVAQTINQHVIRRTTIVISGKAATVPWRDRTCRSGPHRWR
ncbi:DUF4157 domain-containing protein [Streptomyces sp. NPDC005251]|uniref:eCIS core domain-containing protein n=1 Tax=unclassified Streptomyces TaxID=2593676 RepID=UPI0033BA55CF